MFFFSSRRRHTSCLSDWSSDVCSSDLHPQPLSPASGERGGKKMWDSPPGGFSNDSSRQGKRDALRALALEQRQLDLVLGTGHLLDILGGTVDTAAIDVRDDPIRLEASLVGGPAGHDLAAQH